MSTRSLGICVGASNIKTVELIDDNGTLRVGTIQIRSHESNPRKVFTDLIREIDVGSYAYGMLTGRKFRDMINARSITEAEAVEYALRFTGSTDESVRSHTAVASLGAETFIAYVLNTEGSIATVETGNKCASGTGEFFLQQIGRMNISPEEAVAAAKNAEPYGVSGRCSVFCKSDCTHALNKGVPIGRVAAGLSHMMAEKVLDLLGKVETKRILAVGGVTHNSVVMDYVTAKVDALTVPPHADVFEALGAAFYALTNKTAHGIDADRLFCAEKTSFSFLPPLSQGEKLVEFRTMPRGIAQPDDECIVGLDVGSTTTKAVLLRRTDDAILGSVYLRTNGNPVQASRDCYAALLKELALPARIVGVATTGSGRHIAGLHAQTDNIINEIIAHATGAAHFDPLVDTIFEIGGQDAKYTYLTNSVPSDYAMNEACSAGTGSFLEESAKESLGIDFRAIADVADKAQHPPNFNDQCAAFISSDIKTATHEGIAPEDITAGLVYSICMNYVNRVKGQRPIGAKVFMQGGVCYNRAVPLAMAVLIERPIVVPPDPGLIGAFGVALELKNRLHAGLAAPAVFDLAELAAREIGYGPSFVCKGGSEHCDRGCEIAMMTIEGKRYPFGGACNKYYNQVHHLDFDTSGLDFVKMRQDLIFKDYSPPDRDATRKKIGISRSYFANLLFPLCNTFFTRLGLSVVLSDEVDPEGVKRRRSSFCYPGEVAHGCFGNLLKKDLDFLFLPKVMGLHVEKSVNNAREHQSTCVLLQSEAYYLTSAFKDVPRRAEMLMPLIDFSQGFESQAQVFIDLGAKLGSDTRAARDAFAAAVEAQRRFAREIKAIGRRVLDELAATPQRSAVILFGRQYNAFAKEANMGIPAKFASRGVAVIPWDFLPFEDEECNEDMCWAVGQNLLKTASFVKKNPQLYGAFITNFSCGPDSFLVGYVRDIMKTKPSLTLELDSHTADAGVNTRIEAFLDIVKRYREMGKLDDPASTFRRARVTYRGTTPQFTSPDGSTTSFLDPRVHLLIPSMGRLNSEALAACFRGVGVRSSAVPVYDHEALKLGRANASCKECLPLLLTTGGLLKYLKYRPDPSEMLAYFMPFTPGNCRFPQYRVFLNNLIDKQQLANVTIFSLTAEKGYVYEAFTPADRLGFLKGFIVADVMEDIKNALAVLAIDKKNALAVFETQWQRVVGVLQTRRFKTLYSTLQDVAATLAAVPLRYPLSQARKVSLMGEIFVRRDYFSCQDLLERLAKRDIVVKRSHFFEWTKYVDYIIKQGVYEPGFDLKGRIQFEVKLILQDRYERRIKKILAKSGLADYEPISIKRILDYGTRFFDLRFRGESILVVGDFFKEILHGNHGVISIGPFACMPTRVIESVLSAESTIDVKERLDKELGIHSPKIDGVHNLPFLSIESDGNPFPQVVEARVEAFCLQVERLHAKMQGAASPGS